MGRYKPDWLEKPTVDDMEWAYPAHAQRKEIDGKAVITCKVGYDGLLRDCRVVSEAPAGEDFGVAALALSQKFRMIPPTGPVETPPSVTIPIVFKVPRSETPAPIVSLEISRHQFGRVNQSLGTKSWSIPGDGPATDEQLYAVAGIAFLVLMAMFFGLGRHKKRPKTKP